MKSLCRITLSAGFGLAIASAHAQYVPDVFKASDIVIVGEVTGSFYSQDGYRYRSDTPDTREPIEICEAHIRVFGVIKGEPLSEISIALPKSQTWNGTPPDAYGYSYDLRPGKKAIWFLQRSSTGNFTEYLKEQEPIVTYFWKAPGQMFSVSCRQGAHTSHIPIVETSFDSSLPPMLRLADVFARNANLGGDAEQEFLELLKDITPMPSDVLRQGKNLTGDELRQYVSWLDNRFPALYPLDSPAKRLNYLATRMWWGEFRQLGSQFVDLLIQVGQHAVKAPFPIIASTADTLRLMPHLDDGGKISMIVALRDDKADKIEITRYALPFFHRDHHTDGALLEVLSQLWDRPDLNPQGPTQNGFGLMDDLESRIQLALHLLD